MSFPFKKRRILNRNFFPVIDKWEMLILTNQTLIKLIKQKKKFNSTLFFALLFLPI